MNALSQWESATNLITMDYQGTDCAGYTEFVQQMIDNDVFGLADLVNQGLLSSRDITNFVKGLSRYGDFIDEDKCKSEVIMVIDDEAGNKVTELIRAGVFPKLARYYRNPVTGEWENILLDTCILDDPITKACGPRKPGSVITDILLKHSKYRNDLLMITDVEFNKCTPSQMTDLYVDLIHEAGHAFGIRAGTDYDPYDRNYTTHHPTLAGSVMNYNWKPGVPDEPDCSPHPLDILAIYALYQTVP